MRESTTRIAIILDRSGSMESVREATIAGFNEFIEQQKKLPGEATVKLIQFDDQYEEVFDKPLQDVPELTQAMFAPRGWTALWDAQGRTITTVGAELAVLPEDQRPSKVIVMTLTDGIENRSKEFSLERVSELIKRQKEVYNWEFIFLGANQDAVKTARAMNIAPQAAVTYSANAAAMGNVMRSASAYVRGVRGGSRHMAFTDEDRLKAIVEDEKAEDDALNKAVSQK